MINNYLQLTQQLLADPRQEAFNPSFLKRYVNMARGQIAGEARCVRVLGTIPTVVGQRNYNFSALNIGTPATTGVQGIIHIRSIRYALGGGYRWLAPRNWPWFEFYHLNNVIPPSGQPVIWSQYGQGSAGLGTITGDGAAGTGTGSFYIDPVPDIVYTLTCDCACYPIALNVDTDFEAIPYLWTDAVPYYAAYWALMSAGTAQRAQDADRFFNIYKMFVQRARDAATPDVNKYEYEQVPDPISLNQMALPSGRGAAGPSQ